MKNNNKAIRILKISSALCLLFGGITAINTKSDFSLKSVDVFAESDIESSTGVTLDAKESVSITKVTDWASKTLVLDIKTDGTKTQFQLVGSKGASGIFRSGNVGGTDYSASMCSIENSKKGETDESYWWANTVETLSDGWYRWYVSLANLKANDMSNEAVSVNCLSGSNVQVKNLHFLDGQVMYGESGTKLHLANTFNNWKDTTLQVDVCYDSGDQRRFQLCKTSGSGVSGIIRLTKTDSYVENISYVKGGSDPYWLSLGSPVYLGNNWYRHTIDLSKLKIADSRNGTESINQINFLPDTNDPKSLQIRNLKVGNEVYDPTKDAKATINSQYTNIGTTIESDDWYIEDSKDNTVDFDVYGLPLNSFDFSFALDNSRKTAKFKFYENGEIKLTEAGANPVGTIVGSYKEATNGWMNVSINLYSLRQTSGSNINSIRVDNLSGELYIKNLALKVQYDAAKDADFILKSNSRTNIPDIASWSRSTISFEVYHDSLDLSCDPQFIFGKKDTETNITSYFGYKDINSETALWLRNTDDEGSYWVKSTSQPVAVGDGWYKWTIDLSELRAEASSGAETIGNIFNRGANDVYIRNFNIDSVEDISKQDGVLTLKAGERTNIPDIASWGRSTISFEVYQGSLDLTCDPQFIFGRKDTETNITSYFGYKDINSETALWLRNTDDEGSYWVKSTSQPVSVGDGWYKWTIDLSKLRAEAASGAETIGNILNRGDYDVYIRNFNIDSVEDIASQEGVLTLKSKERTNIPDIASWGRSTISFEVYQGSLDINRDPQFQFFMKDSEKYVSSYFGYKEIGSETALWLRNTDDEGKYWVKSTNQPVAVGDGWYKWTIDLSELRAEAASGAETIGSILNRGAYDVYIRNFNIDSVEDISKQEGVVTLKANENTVLEEFIPYWQYTTISFEIYQGSLDINRDPQFQLIMENSDKYVSGFFGYKEINHESALWVRNASSGAYWVKSTNQPVALADGWYKWTIDLSELGNGENCTGVETVSKIRNRGAYDVYIRNLTIDNSPFVLINKKEITVPYEEDLTETLSASIIRGNGQIVYSSDDPTVASVDNNGRITFLKVGTCKITVSVKDKSEIKSATCNITVVGLKDYKILNLDELTDGETSFDFPLVSSLDDDVKTYSYDTISDDNPSVVIRFLVNTSYLEQNRQAVTIWGPTEKGLSNGNYGMWAACYQGAFVFDIFGNNGQGGLKVNGINTTALNSHNTEVQSMITNAYYYIEAGAIDLAELTGETQYTYFYIKVNGNLVWSTIDVAKDEYRNPLVCFTSVGASRSKASKVELVDLTIVTPEGTKVIQVANGLTLPTLTEPVVTDENKKFIGWEKEDGSIWDFDSETIDGAMTLTAKITSDYYTINFDLNYDDNGTYMSKYVGSGMLVKEPVNNPVREGYRFDCWSTSKDGLAFNFYNPINENTTLYAIWVKVYKVTFVYDGNVYLSTTYDEDSYVVDPKWGYKDKPDFGEWADRGMFKLNQLANGRAPYYSLTENGEKVDLDTANIKVVGDTVIYIQFKEVETVMKDDEVYDPNTSKWDYVSIRDLNDTPFKVDEYAVTKYDTSTAEYSPSKNNTTDSAIFCGEIILGDKFKGANVNVGTIALRSSLNAYNSIYLWLRAKEVYLEAKNNSKNVHLAFQSYDMVDGIEDYVEEIDGVTYLKTNVYIPVEYAILAVTTKGFEDYDRVYFKIGGVTIFDVIIPKLCKSAEGESYRVGFVTDSDTASNASYIIKGVYPSFLIEFKDSNGQEIQESITLTKYSYVEKPTYELPAVSGKKFAGWYDSNTMTMWDFANNRVTGNLSLVPTYGYKVVIDPNEGIFADGRTDKQKYDPKEKLVGENCKITFPTDPVYPSNDGFTYKFVGWEKEDGTLWDVKNDVVTSDVYLKARWEKYVTITYYVEDRDYKWESKTIKYGSIVGSPKHGDPDSYDAFDDDEHEFIGWYMYDENGDFVEVSLDELEATDCFSIFAIFDDGTGTITEPEKPTTGGCLGGSGCGGCEGAVGGILSILPVLLYLCMKKRFNNESK